jgi:cyclopropane fatty-acyl-phospholipid synthase-like methyltransferase
LDTFAKTIEGRGQLRMLDVGCGEGDSALRFARLGHQVMGISNDYEDIEIAKKRARQEGLGNCTFEVMDARDMKRKFDQGFFHTVLVADMLHMLDKVDSGAVLESAKALTAPSGYNAIWGYLVDPTKSVSDRNIERMLQPAELKCMYDADPNWLTVHSSEQEFTATIHHGSELVNSHAGLIARKIALDRSILVRAHD